MIGVVLSGGLSTRMGTDKGLMIHEGKTWAQLAFQKLNDILPDVFVSVNSEQAKTYEPLFFLDRLIVDNTAIPVKGPMLALLSCHLQYPDQPVMVLACDMVYMDPVVLQLLVTRYTDQPGHDCYVMHSESGVQPLAAIYSANVLRESHAKASSGSLEKFSVKYMIDNSKSLLLPLPSGWENYFVNFNTAEEVAALSA